MNKPSRLFMVALAILFVPMVLAEFGYRLPHAWSMVPFIAGVGVIAIDQTILFFRTLYGPPPIHDDVRRHSLKGDVTERNDPTRAERGASSRSAR